jgi:hypothetical protein
MFVNWKNLEGSRGLFMVLSQRSPWETEENDEESQPEYPGSRLRLEPETSWIQSRSVNYSDAVLP